MGTQTPADPSGRGGPADRVGPDRPDPFVKGLRDADPAATPGKPDKPDPFMAGLADDDEPDQ